MLTIYASQKGSTFPTTKVAIIAYGTGIYHTYYGLIKMGEN